MATTGTSHMSKLISAAKRVITDLLHARRSLPWENSAEFPYLSVRRCARVAGCRDNVEAQAWSLLVRPHLHHPGHVINTSILMSGTRRSSSHTLVASFTLHGTFNCRHHHYHHLCFNTRLPGEPGLTGSTSVLFLHRSWNKTFEDWLIQLRF